MPQAGRLVLAVVKLIGKLRRKPAAAAAKRTSVAVEDNGPLG
jgi:hypothetical protein